MKLGKIQVLLHRPNLRRVIVFVRQHPLTSFFISLGLLLTLIILGSLFFRPPTIETKKETVVKEVQIFKIGSTPISTFQAQIEKKGVIKIMAQAPTIIQTINIKEGDQVNRNANLITLSSNYQGGNAFAIQTSLAAKQLQIASETQNAQKEIIARERDAANQTETNADKQRDIANQSVNETQDLINLDQQILDTLNKNLADLQSADASPSTLLPLQSSKAQLLGGLNQVKASLRSLQLQADTNNPPFQLAQLQKDITLKQLDLQEKTLQLNKDIAGLQVSLAAINEAMLHPTAPFPGKIERIYVRPGQQVNPGTPLLLLAGNDNKVSVIAKVPRDIAEVLADSQISTLHLGNQTVNLTPDFISTEATDGQLYSVIYKLPLTLIDQVTDGEFILIDIPLAANGFSIPLDAVYQTQDQAYVYVIKDGKAVTKKVKLGTVQGQFVTVISGLTSSDQVIINRNVIEGDLVKTN